MVDGDAAKEIPLASKRTTVLLFEYYDIPR